LLASFSDCYMTPGMATWKWLAVSSSASLN
jgi:hypothetical protein